MATLNVSATFEDVATIAWQAVPQQDPPAVTFAAVTVKIAGTDRTSHVWSKGDLSIEKQIAGRGSASLTLRSKSKATAYRPPLGSPIQILINGVREFSGTIDQIQESLVEGASVEQRLACVDMSRDMDRRVVAGSYTGPISVGLIISDLFLRYLVFGDYPEAQLSMAGIAAYGTTLQGDFRFDYVPFSEALNQVCAAGGLDWTIEDQTLVVRDFSGQASAWDLTDSNLADAENLVVRRDRESYRNRQLVRVPFEVATTYVASFTADGTKTQFFTPHVISEVLSITEDGVSKTFGTIVEDYFTGNLKDWYYQPNQSNDVQTLAPRAPVANGVAVVVTYKGPTRNVVIDENVSEIAARAAVEGNSGVYEAVEDMRSASDETAALELASGLLDLYSTIPTTVRLTTRRGGLRPGRTMTINISDFGGVNDSFLIERVRISRRDRLVVYDIEAANT